MLQKQEKGLIIIQYNNYLNQLYLYYYFYKG